MNGEPRSFYRIMHAVSQDDGDVILSLSYSLDQLPRLKRIAEAEGDPQSKLVKVLITVLEDA